MSDPKDQSVLPNDLALYRQGETQAELEVLTEIRDLLKTLIAMQQAAIQKLESLPMAQKQAGDPKP